MSDGHEAVEILDDVVTLRFIGDQPSAGEDGLHELRAAHVAEVLQGLAGIASDFAAAGAFGDGPSGSEVLVRPAKEGSFIIEVIRQIADSNLDPVDLLGVPTLGSVIWWATKSARADISAVEYLANGNVLVTWQDDTVNEIPKTAWDELNKRNRRRKKHLRQIMAPLSDSAVVALEISSPPELAANPSEPIEPTTFSLGREDYDAVRPDLDVDTKSEILEVEAQMSAIDFDDPEKWRVKTVDAKRMATVEDQHFLQQVATGLAIRKNDIFRLKIREDVTKKNGRTQTRWTVLEVTRHRRSVHDDDDA